MNKHGLKVGQTLWFESNDRRGKVSEETVVAVGNKWATLEHGRGRVDLETLVLHIPRYAGQGVCYLSREAYEQKVQLDALWGELRDVFNGYRPVDGVSVEQLIAVKATLGLS